MHHNDFRTVASLNPFISNYDTNFTTSSQHNVTINILDLLGRLIEFTAVIVSDLNNTKIGAQYSVGIYNVMVIQSGVVKVLLVIKRPLHSLK